VGHGGENPHHGVGSSLAETSPDGSFALVSNGIKSHPIRCEIAFLLRQPPCVMREVWEQAASISDFHTSARPATVNSKPLYSALYVTEKDLRALSGQIGVTYYPKVSEVAR
jgi:hypothetical protein